MGVASIIYVVTQNLIIYEELCTAMSEDLPGLGVQLISVAKDIERHRDFLLIVDTESMSEGLLAGWLQIKPHRTIVLNHLNDAHSINIILRPYPINHIVGYNGRSWVQEITIIARKLTGGNIFGLAYYGRNDARSLSWDITSAGAVDELVDEMARSISWEKTYDAFMDAFKILANELLTNAVYNAPKDDTGQFKYKETDRKVKIDLLPSEFSKVSLLDHPEYVALSVLDQFGGLDRSEVVRHLEKCVNDTQFIDDKKGGSGAGIYLVFYSSSQYVINRSVGKKLEIICIMEKTRRYKKYRERVTSFSYFVE